MKKREYYPGYEPLPERTSEEIEAELNRRTGYVQGVVRHIDPATVVSLPPPPEHKPSRLIRYIPKPGKRDGNGRFN